MKMKRILMDNGKLQLEADETINNFIFGSGIIYNVYEVCGPYKQLLLKTKNLDSAVEEFSKWEHKFIKATKFYTRTMLINDILAHEGLVLKDVNVADILEYLDNVCSEYYSIYNWIEDTKNNYPEVFEKEEANC